jgi:hypothetical protein
VVLLVENDSSEVNSADARKRPILLEERKSSHNLLATQFKNVSPQKVSRVEPLPNILFCVGGYMSHPLTFSPSPFFPLCEPTNAIIWRSQNAPSYEHSVIKSAPPAKASKFVTIQSNPSTVHSKLRLILPSVVSGVWYTLEW